jgi:glycolate oxidase
MDGDTRGFMHWRWHLMSVGNNAVADKLRGLVRGRVIVDEKTLQQFSRDQSIYEIKPRVVVFPQDIEDVQALICFAAREGLPITPRGGGSGTAGSALGQGLVIALPDNAFWGQISGFSATINTARVTVRAGVHHNTLQRFLKEHGFFLPADVTSADISRIGGNIATRASGPHSFKHGSIARFLEQVEFISADGELIDTSNEATIPERFKNKLADLTRRIRLDESVRGILNTRRGLKTSSGYDFLSDLSAGQRIVQLLAGSVGTLGLITRATLRGETHELERAVIVLHFDDLKETVKAVSALRELHVAAIELISRETMRIIRELTSLADRIDVDAHILMVELTGHDCQEDIERITTILQQTGCRMSIPLSVATSGEDVEKLWSLRKRILWLIQHPKPGLKALAVVNDVGVPPDDLMHFIAEVEGIFARHKIIALVYGHAGEGNLHLRPLFDVALPDLPGRVRRLADDIYEAVFRHHGTVTSEHGMGRLRAPYLRREWGERVYNYMQDIKTIFDPKDIFNPGVMFGNAPITDHMRPDILEL